MYGLLAFLLCWAACKKDNIPPDVIEDPVFNANYQVTGGDTASVTAGLNGVYLFTDYEVRGQKILCKGSFADATCPRADCPGSLTFEFSTPFTDVFPTDTVFHTGSFNYVNLDSGGAVVIYRGTFQVDDTSGFDSFTWYVNDNTAGDGPNLVYDFSNISVTPLIDLKAQRNSGLLSNITRTVSLSGATSPVQVSMKINQDTVQIYKLTTEIIPAGFDSLVINGVSVQDTVLYSDALPDAYSILVQKDIYVARATLEGLNSDELPVRTPNFSFTVEPVSIPGPPGEVTIQWVDPSGSIWRSDRNDQAPFSSFLVETSEDYEKNEKGQKTRKMNVFFVCRLFNTAGESRTISGSGVIAVAYPD